MNSCDGGLGIISPISKCSKIKLWVIKFLAISHSKIWSLNHYCKILTFGWAWIGKPYNGNNWLLSAINKFGDTFNPSISPVILTLPITWF